MSANLNLDSFGDRLIALLPQLMQEILRYENNYVTTGKITCQQFAMLTKIMEKDLWTMNELAKAMNLSFPATTGLVDRLVKHRLIRRWREAKDRRVVSVAVTDKGKKVIKEVYAQKRKGMIEPIFGQIKQVRGFRQFLLRGLAKMRGEWRLICLTHNLRKLFGSGRWAVTTG